MTDGVLLGATVFGLGLACGLMIALYFFMRLEANHAEDLRFMRAQMAAFQEMFFDTDDDDEVSAEELGYE